MAILGRPKFTLIKKKIQKDDKKVCAVALIHFDDRLTALSDADPLHFHLEVLLNESNVVLCILGQVAEVSNVGC